jgi:hypothetical protein
VCSSIVSPFKVVTADSSALFGAQRVVNDHIRCVDQEPGDSGLCDPQAVGGDVVGGDVEKPEGKSGDEHRQGRFLEAIAGNLDRAGQQQRIGERDDLAIGPEVIAGEDEMVQREVSSLI